ncbi:MAG: undecaprenyl-phosphate glucose phosphotransferase [Hyphomicrobium sp.]|nr:undecaprenyl-phosphate glucose phosphotransferase [Hyphomicrobium sp.]PPC83681.1 MAG: undecaprenyl-phosphate glucose phosphotransferase [Hyphomicrobium sp.]
MAVSTVVDATTETRLSAPGQDHPVKSRWSRRIAADMVALADMIAVMIAGVLPAWIYNVYGGVNLDWTLVLQSIMVAAFLVQVCLRYWGLYDTRKMHDFPQDPARLLAALLIGILGVLGLCLPQAMRNVHMWIWYAAWLSASFTLILLVRLSAQALLSKFTADGRFEQHIAVFGAGAIARRVKEHLTDKSLGVHFAGVYDDRMGDDRVDPEGLTVNGKLDDLIKAAREDKIDQIIVALPQAADRRMADVVRKLEQLPVSVHIVTHIASDLVGETQAHAVSSLGPVGLLDVKSKPFSDWGPVIKTLEDYVLCMLFVLITLPLLPIIALAIRLDSPGPILFTQKRRGLNHKVFEVFKFRTMTVMEDGDDVRQASAMDPRITRVGKWLRRSSLDELPQLWNVLRGEMSLVGPRPHALVHDDEFSQKLEEYAARHQVKPGITGLAQVKGCRGETSTTAKIKSRVEHDIHYIKTWSLGLDLKILCQTLGAVISGKNAN